jgi:AraC-like DNA-binding protein
MAGVSSALAPALLRLARSRGLDGEALALRAGIDPAIADLDAAAVAPHLVAHLLAVTAEMLRDPFLALSLPEMLPMRRYHFADLCARASATVGEGLARHARYAAIAYPGATARVDTHDGSFVWRAALESIPRDGSRIANESVIANAFGFARRLAAVNIAPRRVWFAHARPRDLAPLVRHFGTRDLSFGAIDNGLDLATLDTDRPAATRDDRLLATVESLAESELVTQHIEPRFSDAVSSAIATSLPIADIESISNSLHMSARTLQRRLDDEGVRYSELVDRVRESIARDYLRDPRKSLVEIAEHVGFSDLASFGRAFKRWTGEPPSHFKRAG